MTGLRRCAAAVFVALMCAGTASACSGGSGGDDATSAVDGGGGGGGSTDDAGAAEAGTGTTAAPVDLASAVPPERSRSVISNAELTIEARDPEAAIARAGAVVTDAGGFLFAQDAALADDVAIVATYKVPPDRFDAVLAAVSELGDVEDRQVDTLDVTGQVVDLDARLASARTSVERLRSLLADSANVPDLLAVEQTLATREAEMESLAAQVGALRAQVDLATVTVRMTPTPEVVAATTEGDDIPGFLAGLRTGARAFADAILVVLTVTGFALPFLALAAVIGLPTWWVLRRRRTSAPAV